MSGHQKQPPPICPLWFSVQMWYLITVPESTLRSFSSYPHPFCMQRPSTLSMSNPLRKEGESAALYAANRQIKRGSWAAPRQNKNRPVSSISSALGESKDLVKCERCGQTEHEQRARAAARFPHPCAQWTLKHRSEIKLWTLGRFCQRGCWKMKSMCVCVCVCVCLYCSVYVFHRHTNALGLIEVLVISFLSSLLYPSLSVCMSHYVYS